MCLAVPGRIVECEGALGVVDFGGLRRRISLALVPGAAEGDWVLIHTGFAIQVLDADAAARQLELVRSVLEQAGGVEDDSSGPVAG